MNIRLFLVLVFVTPLLLSACFLGSGGRDASPVGDSQRQNTAQNEVLTEYAASRLDDPALARIYHQRGAVFAALGQRERAIEHFSEAINLDPSFAEAYFARGMANLESGQLETAIRDLDHAVKISPGMTQAHVGSGRAFAALNQPQRALQEFHVAIRLSPNDAAAHYQMANTYAELGNPGEAIPEWERATELDPQLAQAYHRLGDAYRSKAQFVRAIVNLDRPWSWNQIMHRRTTAEGPPMLSKANSKKL